MSYYEQRIAELEARIAELTQRERMKAIPVEARLMVCIGELNDENARLKAEVEMWKLRSDNWQKFCELNRPEMTDEVTRLKADVERLTAKQGGQRP